MIVYFSGTGNSRYAAETLAALTDDAAFALGSGGKGKERVLGIVFPIHAWNVPKTVRNYVEGLKLSDVDYTFALCTCGDDAGHAMKQLQAKYGFDAVFSLSMPNNYIIMFDVDPPEVQQKKLAAAKLRLEDIARRINGREKGYDVHEGSMAAFKTRFISPMFEKHAMSDKAFYATDACIGCGHCADSCPVGNIAMAEGRPVWQGHCVQCLACLHRCPVTAVQYGKKTANKGRYVNPETI